MAYSQEQIEKLNRELRQAKGKLTEAEQKLTRRPGVKLHITEVNYVLSGLFRRPRLKYRIKCNNCQFLFAYPSNKHRVICPNCGYGAKLSVLEKELEERREL